MSRGPCETATVHLEALLGSLILLLDTDRMGQGKNLLTHVTHRHHSRTLFLYTSSSSKVCSHRSLGSKIQKGEVVGRLGTAEHAGDGADTSSICTTLLNKPHSTSADRPLLCTDISRCLHVYVHALRAAQCVFFPARVQLSIAAASQHGPSCSGARATRAVTAVALSHGCWVDVWKQLEH